MSTRSSMSRHVTSTDWHGVSRRHSSLDRRGDHSAASQGAGLPAVRDAVASGAGAVQITNCPATSRCCATATAGGPASWATTTSATATAWAPPRSPRCCAGARTPASRWPPCTCCPPRTCNAIADELASLIEIITDVVEEICAPANRWSVRTVGDLELLGEEPARRLRDAVDVDQRHGRVLRPSTSTSPSATAAARRSSTPSGRCWARNWPTASAASS